MALTFRRWAIGTGLGCLALTAVLLPPDPGDSLIRWLPWSMNFGFWARPSVPGDSLVLLNNRLNHQLGSAVREWAILSWRDSIVRDRGRVADARGNAPQLVTRMPVPPMQLRALRTTIERAWAGLPRRDSTVWVIVALVPDSLAGLGGRYSGAFFLWGDPILLLDPVVEPKGCILLVPGTRLGSIRRNAIADALSPCAWRAAFGPPGVRVARWLNGQAWEPAYGLDWWSGALSARRLIQGWDDSGNLPWELAEASGSHADRLFRNAVYQGAWTEAECFAGESSGCARRILTPTPRRRWGGERSPTGVLSPPWGNVLTTGFLQRMLTEVGPDRFREFWTSSLPLDSAFQQVMGRPIGEWTQDLVESRVGRASRGPAIAWGPVVASVLLGAALVAGAVGGSVRRVAR